MAGGLLTIEENAVAEALAADGLRLPLLQVGIPDRFIEHGSREDCLAATGLDAHGLIDRIECWWSLHSAACVRSVVGV
jgi:1-deoxy-D-xylulose-5-phosphate synthase